MENTYIQNAEDWCTIETTKLLLEKGFDDAQCRFVVEKDGTYHRGEPSLYMAMKWLREDYELLISINPTADKDGFVCIRYYIWKLDDINTEPIIGGLYSIDSYQECANDAIKYCLENLL